SIVLANLDAAVANALERARSALSRAGVLLTDLPLGELGDILAANEKGGFAAAEAAAGHAPPLAPRGADYDPRVRVRIERGARITAQEYVALVKERGRIIKRVDEVTAGHDAWLMPTTPIIAPPFSAFNEDAEYARLNILLLRNCLLVNF